MSTRKSPVDVAAPPVEPAIEGSAPARESYPLAIGETDHLEGQASAHHFKGDDAPPADASLTKES